MNISAIITNSAGWVMAPMSMVLNPAVRAVTDWNQAASTRSPSGSPASVRGLFHSSSRKASVPPASSAAVATSTSRVWTESRTWRRFSRISSAQTKNPSPPAMIRLVITRLTTRSPRHDDRLSLHRAKPALLNPETAWKTPCHSASPEAHHRPPAQREDGGADALDDERQLQHRAGEADQALHVLDVERLLQGEPFLQRDRAADGGHEHRAEGHVAQPAGLDEQHDHHQAEAREVHRGVERDQAGDAYRRDRGEEGVEDRDLPPLGRCDRQRQEQAADADDRQEARGQELRRRQGTATSQEGILDA